MISDKQQRDLEQTETPTVAQLLGMSELDSEPETVVEENENIFEDGEDDPAAIATQHSIADMAGSRIALVGGAIGILVFGAGGLWTLINNSTRVVENPAAPVEENVIEAEAPPQPDGALKTEIALAQQREELAALGELQPQQPANLPTQPLPQPEETPIEPEPVQTPVAVSIPQRERPRQLVSQPRPQPRPQPQPRQIAQPLPTPQPKPASNPGVQPAKRAGGEEIDPYEKWLMLASAGSYGQIPYSEAKTPTTPIANVETTENQTIQSVPSWEPRLPTAPVSTTVSASGYDLEAEARILSGTTAYYLVAGEGASAVLETPIMWASSQADSPDTLIFTAQLQEPLLDNQGQIAIPAGSRLLLQRQSTSGELVQLAVKAIAIDGTEYAVPDGAMSVRGQQGRPLVASKHEDIGDELLGYDVTLGLVGGLARVGEELTRPESEETLEDERPNGTIRIRKTTTKSDRNLPGAFVEGAFGVLQESIEQRTQQATAEAMERINDNPLWVVERGTELYVVVDSSFQVN
ncbi:TrbI/VirB10 family protein [Coleofasciculus sp. E1-EBD-02]|uniref:TrbI/VirB10 family protein n=1 Tax=Coleofasciculus sp. E1-EBD-02 TaxID=3068481 RepID=UPI003301CBB0